MRVVSNYQNIENGVGLFSKIKLATFKHVFNDFPLHNDKTLFFLARFARGLSFSEFSQS